MTDRLKQLQRQRALIQEHLAWLDREIVREAGPASPAAKTSLPASPIAPAPVTAPTTASPAVASSAEAEAEALMAEYRRDPESLQSSVKKGCLLYFFGAFALIALGLAAFYFLRLGR